ncbi:MAG TPA: prolipoprotein diacylglyceryl transferase [Candidatus Dormibacteraeota bacterium]|nr:prolipoprotein diacylglyceryl transferase [Candidatus Dormibacteraeota bacterium]
MYPILFHVFGIPIEAFWATVFLGFAASLLVVRADLIRLGRDSGAAYDLILWAYVGGFIGARLLLVVTAWDDFQRDPFEHLFSGSGWVWQGGIIGGAVAVIWKARRLGLPLGEVADFSGPALAIGQAIGRLGCQLSGDGDYGVPTDLPWGMSYPNGVVPTTDRVHPTPIYEMIGCLLIFAWLWRRRARPHVPGSLFGEYLIATGVLRFAVEFVRRNPAMAFGLTIAQWLSLVSIAIGAGLLLRRAPWTAAEAT